MPMFVQIASSNILLENPIERLVGDGISLPNIAVR
jgi:hypothetical protein